MAGRPRGAARPGSLAHKLATTRDLTTECKARFLARFGFAWTYDLADRILGDDALSMRGILRRSGPLAAEERARKVLNELRSRALAAAKAVRSGSSGALGEVLRTIVYRLPAELLADDAAWARRTTRPRRRVMMNAGPALGVRKLEARDLAVIGILAGVRVQIRRGDCVADVLRREARCYSSARRR